jgi:lipopolysaccharide transport system ATP-binding protein
VRRRGEAPGEIPEPGAGRAILPDDPEPASRRTHRRPPGPTFLLVSEMEHPKIIEAEALTKRYPGGVTALSDLTLAVEPGITGLVGANGAGKSTLLRCATGISAPDQGRVQIRGTIAALMELGAGFHPDLTGAENVLLNASLLGLTRKETLQQFDRIVEFSGLGSFIDEPLRTYSSGMVLRLAFSVAVRVDPDILVIDEILAVGDIDFQEKCIAEIMRLKQSGKTLIYVAHNLPMLRKVCEQALWLERGQLRMFGPCDEVLDAYEAAPPPPSL